LEVTKSISKSKSVKNRFKCRNAIGGGFDVEFSLVQVSEFGAELKQIQNDHVAGNCIYI
jgi:hypothetical protein